jgi:protein-S-isoprenylcysteine O-methyltransferase Ste14
LQQQREVDVNLSNQPWDIVFLIGFAAYLGIRYAFSRRAKGEATTVNRMDGTEKALLGAVFLGNIFLPMLYLFTPVLSFADYPLPALAPWCGSAVMASALWLFWRSHADLGTNWSASLEIRSGHQLIIHGVYRSIRHPMYASIWLFGIAQALLLANWVAGFSAMATFAPLYLLRVPREEAMMCEFFGGAYQDYKRQTGRLFPRLRRSA